MKRLGHTFGGYRVHEAVLTRAAWTMYRATSSQGPRIVYRGISSTTSRTISLWVSNVLEDVSVVAATLLQQTGKTNGIDHPAIAPVLDAGERDGRVYFVTRHLDGMTLDELIRRRGPMPAGDAVELLAPIADGLDHAHSIGLVHGAICQSTIWVSSSSDDGVAAMLTGYGLGALLRSHIRRTPHDDAIARDVLYIAPDQLRVDTSAVDDTLHPPDSGGRDRYTLRPGAPDESVDQYALACALYHCVTGRPPFEHDTVASLFEAHALAAPPPVRTVGDTAERAIRSGMAKQPADRHVSCLALMHAIASDQSETAPGFIPDALHRNRRQRSVQGSRTRGIGWWVGVGLLASLVTVTAIVVTAAVATFFG